MGFRAWQLYTVLGESNSSSELEPQFPILIGLKTLIIKRLGHLVFMVAIQCSAKKSLSSLKISGIIS